MMTEKQFSSKLEASCKEITAKHFKGRKYLMLVRFKGELINASFQESVSEDNFIDIIADLLLSSEPFFKNDIYYAIYYY